MENRFVNTSGKGKSERGMEWEFRVGRYKLLYAERINNKVLLYRI